MKVNTNFKSGVSGRVEQKKLQLRRFVRGLLFWGVPVGWCGYGIYAGTRDARDLILEKLQIIHAPATHGVDGAMAFAAIALIAVLAFLWLLLNLNFFARCNAYRKQVMQLQNPIDAKRAERIRQTRSA